MKTIQKITFMLLLAAVLQSCYTTRTNVGGFREAEGKTYTYSKAKQFYLFWGLISIGHVHTETPQDGTCQVKTKFNFIDGVISLLTGGILSSQTIKVLAKKEKNKDDKTSENTEPANR